MRSDGSTDREDTLMFAWMLWTVLGLLVWFSVSVPLGIGVGHLIRVGSSEPNQQPVLKVVPNEQPAQNGSRATTDDRPRVLIVDDEPSLRSLVRTTLAESDLEVREAETAEEAAEIVAGWRPSLVLLDVALPGADGLSLCRQLKENSGTEAPAVLLLTGSDLSQTAARVAGADALLRKPFSPLELVSVLERLVGRGSVGLSRLRAVKAGDAGATQQLNLYARDLGELLALERVRRTQLEQAYHQTIESLARALEWKDAATAGHALRVQRYALQLAAAVDPGLLADPSAEAGFLLHDVGKIAIPDSILRKRGPLTPSEQNLMRQHTLIGSELLAGIPLLAGQGLGVVRSHHERWDGAGYPDGLAEEEIPPAARIFAVADALDAMTSDRPYRKALRWETAAEEIAAQRGRHFDPDVVDAFAALSVTLEGMHAEFDRVVA
jgi:response regulator RpfG family c-di-GMP phosphodiesterase